MEDFVFKLGSFCKACKNFFRLVESHNLEKRYEIREGEECLVELIEKCPKCGEANSFSPDEATLENADDRKLMGLPFPR